MIYSALKDQNEGFKLLRFT